MPVVDSCWPATRQRPRTPSARRAVAAGVLVLLVGADEDAGLHEVLAEDLRVVVLDDEQILVVEERRLVPERAVARRRPRRPDARFRRRTACAADEGRSAISRLVISRSARRRGRRA